MHTQGNETQEQSHNAMNKPDVVDLYLNNEPEFWRQYNEYIMEGFNDNGETQPIHLEGIQESVGC